MAADNIDIQISALQRLWTRELDAGNVTTGELLEYARGAGAVMQDGVEVIRVAFTDGSTEGMVMYPKYVVMTAALNVLDAADAGADAPAEGSGTVHFDLSRGRIET